MASSLVLMMVGRIMIVHVRTPARSDQPIFSLMTKKMKPKRPYRMEGMPARGFYAEADEFRECRFAGVFGQKYSRADTQRRGEEDR